MHNETTVEDILSRGIQGGEDLAAVRKAANCSVQLFSTYLSVDTATLYRWERNVNSTPPRAIAVAELLYWKHVATVREIGALLRAMESPRYQRAHVEWVYDDE